MSLLKRIQFKWGYTLEKPLYHSTTQKPGGSFKNKWVSIEIVECAPGRTLIIISMKYSWDGCSVVPDFKGTKWASCLHDAIYQFADDIAREWGWTVRQVLVFADKLFEERMWQDGADPLVVKTYYRGVRVAGYPFNRTMKFIKWIWRGPPPTVAVQ